MNVADPGFWCSYHRPAFLQPEDERFEEISALYYKELTKLYGKTGFYAIDPFHEGGSTQGVNLDAAGKAIMKAMKKTNPDAVWAVSYTHLGLSNPLRKRPLNNSPRIISWYPLIG